MLIQQSRLSALARSAVRVAAAFISVRGAELFLEKQLF